MGTRAGQGQGERVRARYPWIGSGPAAALAAADGGVDTHTRPDRLREAIPAGAISSKTAGRALACRDQAPIIRGRRWPVCGMDDRSARTRRGRSLHPGPDERQVRGGNDET